MSQPLSEFCNQMKIAEFVTNSAQLSWKEINHFPMSLIGKLSYIYIWAEIVYKQFPHSFIWRKAVHKTRFAKELVR